MKKFAKILTILTLSTSIYAGVVKIGASPVPHLEILNYVKDDLQKQGVKLKVVEFTDYVTPNLALDDKSIDANFFQHLPYLEKFAQERKLNLASAGQVHVEPIGLYSKKVKSVKDLKKRSVIAIPNDPTNGGRALILLHNNGIITLKDPKDLSCTESDIVKNPKKLKFKSVEAAQLPRVLKDVDAAIINSNYSLEAGLNPKTDALLIEGSESPYANIIAVRKGDEKKEDIKKLINVLQTEKVRKFINEKYKGAVVPAF